MSENPFEPPRAVKVASEIKEASSGADKPLSAQVAGVIFGIVLGTAFVTAVFIEYSRQSAAWQFGTENSFLPPTSEYSFGNFLLLGCVIGLGGGMIASQVALRKCPLWFLVVGIGLFAVGLPATPDPHIAPVGRGLAIISYAVIFSGCGAIFVARAFQQKQSIENTPNRYTEGW